MSVNNADVAKWLRANEQRYQRLSARNTRNTSIAEWLRANEQYRQDAALFDNRQKVLVFGVKEIEEKRRKAIEFWRIKYNGNPADPEGEIAALKELQQTLLKVNGSATTVVEILKKYVTMQEPPHGDDSEPNVITSQDGPEKDVDQVSLFYNRRKLFVSGMLEIDDKQKKALEYWKKKLLDSPADPLGEIVAFKKLQKALLEANDAVMRLMETLKKCMVEQEPPHGDGSQPVRDQEASREQEAVFQNALKEEQLRNNGSSVMDEKGTEKDGDEGVSKKEEHDEEVRCNTAGMEGECSAEQGLLKEVAAADDSRPVEDNGQADDPMHDIPKEVQELMTEGERIDVLNFFRMDPADDRKHIMLTYYERKMRKEKLLRLIPWVKPPHFTVCFFCGKKGEHYTSFCPDELSMEKRMKENLTGGKNYRFAEPCFCQLNGIAQRHELITCPFIVKALRQEKIMDILWKSK